MNRAVQITHFAPFDANNPTNIRVVDVPKPQPGPKQALCRITLRPVNPSDVMTCEGWYSGFKPDSFPATPGFEGTGVVAELGPGCSGKVAVGQRVVGVPWAGSREGNGTWQQFVVVPEALLLAVPDSVSDEAAAQFFVNPLSAYALLENSAVPEGEWLLQSAAASTLGRMLIQMAKKQGTKTINIVRRREQVAELKALGADEVIVSTEEDVVQRVKEITGGKGAWAAVECVGGPLAAQVLAAVRPGGTMRVYGKLSPEPAQYDAADLFFGGKTVVGWWLFLVRRDQWSEERWQQAVADVMGMLADGTITPYSGRRFPLDQVVEAVRQSQQPGREGKVLLEG